MSVYLLVIFVWASGAYGAGPALTVSSQPMTLQACLIAADDAKKTLGIKDGVVTARCYPTGFTK